MAIFIKCDKTSISLSVQYEFELWLYQRTHIARKHTPNSQTKNQLKMKRKKRTCRKEYHITNKNVFVSNAMYVRNSISPKLFLLYVI